MTLEQFFEQFDDIGYVKLTSDGYKYHINIKQVNITLIERFFGYERTRPELGALKGRYLTSKVNQEADGVKFHPSPYRYVLWVCHNENISCVFSKRKLKSWFIKVLLKNIGER